MKDFDLSKLFGSKCRCKILEKFFLEFEAGNNYGFHMRAISRETGEQINSVKRELDNLYNLGIFRYKVESKKKIYYLNQNYLLLDELKNIFIKSYNPMEKVKKFFSKQKGLELVILNESLRTKMYENDGNVLLDIFMVGEIDKNDLNDFLGATFYNKKIKFAVVSKSDYKNRVSFGDKLISNIMKQPGNIYLIDKLDVEKNLKK